MICDCVPERYRHCLLVARGIEKAEVRITRWDSQIYTRSCNDERIELYWNSTIVGNAPVCRDNGGRAGLAFAYGKYGASFWNKILDPTELGFIVSLWTSREKGKRSQLNESYMIKSRFELYLIWKQIQTRWGRIFGIKRCDVQHNLLSSM